MPMDVMAIAQDITAIVTRNMTGTETTATIEIAGIADRIIVTEDTTDVHTDIIPGQTSILLVLGIDTTDLVIVLEEMGAGKVRLNMVVEKGHSCLSKVQGCLFYLSSLHPKSKLLHACRAGLPSILLHLWALV